MRKSYSRDPFWMLAKFNSVCECGKPIKKGSRIYYYPIGKKALCEVCGETAAAEFAAIVQDEQVYNYDMAAY